MPDWMNNKLESRLPGEIPITSDMQIIKWKSESEVAQSCSTLCDPVDCSLPGSSVHGILQARILEWVAISFSRESSRPRDRTRVSHIAGRQFNLWAIREAHADNTTLIKENEEEINSFLMNVKEESEKAGLKTMFRKQIQWHLAPSLHGK